MTNSLRRSLCGLIMFVSMLAPPSVSLYDQRDASPHQLSLRIMPNTAEPTSPHLPLPRSSSAREHSPQLHSDQVPPGNFPFQTVTSPDGKIVLHFYGRGPSFAGDLFTAIQQSLVTIVAPHLGLNLTMPLDIYVYNSRADFLAGAQPPNPTETSAFARLQPPTIYLPIRLGADPFHESTLAHELTHIVLHNHVLAGQIDIDYAFYPLWFDEGLAAFSEVDGVGNARDYPIAIANARANHTLIDIFTAFRITYPADLATNFLAYAESRAFIQSLYTTYGQAAFQQFIALTADGDLAYAALVAFGKDLVALQNAWNAAQGLPETSLVPLRIGAPPTPIPYQPATLAGNATTRQIFPVDGWVSVARTPVASILFYWLLLFLWWYIAWRRERRAHVHRFIAGGLLMIPAACFVGWVGIAVIGSLRWAENIAILAGCCGIATALMALWAVRRHWYTPPHLVILLLCILLTMTVTNAIPATNIAQGAAFEDAGAYTLALQFYTQSGTANRDLARVHFEWYVDARRAGDLAAASEHLRLSIELEPQPKLAQRRRASLSPLLQDWLAQLSKAHQFALVIRATTITRASKACDQPCRDILRDIAGNAYLAWAQDHLWQGDGSGGLAILSSLQQALPGTKQAKTAQTVLDQQRMNLAGVIAARQMGDNTAGNLLGLLVAMAHPGTADAAIAARLPVQMSGTIASTTRMPGTTHMVFLAFPTPTEARAFRAKYTVDTSLFKIAAVADASGKFSAMLPAGYAYLIIWETKGSDSRLGWFQESLNVFIVDPFTPLTDQLVD